LSKAGNSRISCFLLSRPLLNSFTLVNGNTYCNSNPDHKYAHARARRRVTFDACVSLGFSRHAVACDATRATATHRSLDASLHHPLRNIYDTFAEVSDMFGCIRAHLLIVLFIYKIKSFFKSL